MAAVIAGGPRALLSHRSAGTLWRLTPPSSSQVDITCASDRRRAKGIQVHRSRVPGDERAEVDGIPVTSPFRTMLDLAGVLTPRQLERAWNELQVRSLTDVVPMAVLLERHPGKRGLANLRAVIGSKKPGGITRNDFEEAFVALLDAHGLPRPRLNASLWVRGHFFEPDALWEAQRLIVELDGGEVHRTDHAFQSDRQRDRILLAEGWRTTRVTWHQLRDEPAEVAADLRQVLEPNQPTPPVPQSRYPHPPAK